MLGVVGNFEIDASKSKTNEARGIPMTSRLRAILEMRQHGPDGQPFPIEAHIFGNDVGEPVRSIYKGWDLARRRAGIHELHFHDLRREFASRLMESGAAEHDVRDWLGHANITTTSRYLSSSAFRRQDVMKRFEAARQQAQSAGATDDVPKQQSLHVEEKLQQSPRRRARKPI